MLLAIVPAALPEGYGEALLSVAAAKAWLRVDGDEDDDLIAVLRDIAIDVVERYINCRLGPVTGMVARFAGFGSAMRLGWGPAASIAITEIAYIDTSGGSVAMSSDTWRVGVDGAILPAVGARWPTAGGQVSVTFDAGYPEGACPASLLGGARMMLAMMYDKRDALLTEGMEADLPVGVVMACSRYRERPGL